MSIATKGKGIYSISCIHTGQRYIGQATNLKKRWGEHKGKLLKGKHPNYLLQRLWDTWGPDGFVFVVLEQLPSHTSREWLTVREQYWIDHFKPLVLNISRYADSYRYLLELKVARVNRLRDKLNDKQSQRI